MMHAMKLLHHTHLNKFLHGPLACLVSLGGGHADVTCTALVVFRTTSHGLSMKDVASAGIMAGASFLRKQLKQRRQQVCPLRSGTIKPILWQELSLPVRPDHSISVALVSSVRVSTPDGAVLAPAVLHVCGAVSRRAMVGVREKVSAESDNTGDNINWNDDDLA
jgi:hypothetical protein